jgi:hypothetical protein
MAKRIWLLCATLAVIGVVPPSTSAKPGDLPVDITQQCPDAREPFAEGWIPPSGDGLAARPWAGADAAPRVRSNHPPARDASPRPVNQARGTHHRVRREMQTPATTPQDAEAARLFALGERCRQIGDHAQARVCYEEAHVVSPTSVAGRLAIDRLRMLELQRLGLPADGAEEAEMPAFAQPQRPVIEPGEGSTRRQPGSQSGTTPEHQPQLPPVPTPSKPSELQKLKKMLESTVPLGGAEEQETSTPSNCDARTARDQWNPGWAFVGFSTMPPASTYNNQPFFPFTAWSRAESVTDWVTKAIYAQGEYGVHCSTCFPSPPTRLVHRAASAGPTIGQRTASLAARQPTLPFIAWTRADVVADWATAVIYARRDTYAWWETTFVPPPEPGDCDGQAEKDWWTTSLLSPRPAN